MKRRLAGSHEPLPRHQRFPKLFVEEPESERVYQIIGSERALIVSALTRLEALVQIDSRVAGGKMSAEAAQLRRAAVEQMLNSAPFAFRDCPEELFTIAENQLGSTFCRTLDRLHLATMEALNLRRLFTNDDQQADAARALGWSVILPR